MENFPFKHEGKTYWYSRSMAVAVFVYTHFNGELHVLMDKRGPGTPDFQGCWSAPCGYLDHNETLSTAAARECLEEVGLVLDEEELIPIELNSDPKSSKQNITQRYITYIPYERFTENDFSDAKSEKDEVAGIRWVPVTQLRDKRMDFAFGHEDIALEYASLAMLMYNISVYSSYDKENKIKFQDIHPYSVVDIRGMLFVVSNTVSNGVYVNGKVSVPGHKHMIGCNISHMGGDTNMLNGYVASSLDNFNVKIFIH